MLETFIGSAAALCTTASYIPQVRQCWTTRETADLSLKMLLLLAAGLSLWLIYGLLRTDAVIIGANAMSLGLVESCSISSCGVRTVSHPRRALSQLLAGLMSLQFYSVP